MKKRDHADGALDDSSIEDVNVVAVMAIPVAIAFADKGLKIHQNILR